MDAANAHRLIDDAIPPKLGRCSPATLKAVLWSLASFAPPMQMLYPSQSSIARRACLTDRAVRMAMTEFEQAGVLVRHAAGTIPGKTTAVYELNYEALSEWAQSAPPESGKGVRLSGSSKAEPRSATGSGEEPRSAPTGTTFR